MYKQAVFSPGRERRLDAQWAGDFTDAQWEEVKNEQDHKCKMCGVEEGAKHWRANGGKGWSKVKLTRDHITPLSRGGKHTKSNIQALCYHCNQEKGNKLGY
jgi:5-methylcytosine-specific restriction endonuclease McrA